MSASPQCQISRPGAVWEFTQSGSSPVGSAAPQAVVGILSVRFGGLTQPSTQTTWPDRSKPWPFSPGHPLKYLPSMIARCLKRCSWSGDIRFGAVVSLDGAPGLIWPPW